MKTRTHYARRRSSRRSLNSLDLWQIHTFLDGLASASESRVQQVRSLLREIAADDALWNTIEKARQHEAQRAATIRGLQAAYARLEKSRKGQRK